ncbi:MAG: AAA family ATPase [Patescibacteria group bacterium]
MFLEKLEIQGFKSFASKNTLVFPGMLDKSRRGITVIVGPNGSGKSNTADAVRWALGEQSIKTLRGKKSEDIIFSGSDKKGRLNMAEVSLYLNNEDRQSPIDYTQVVLTRRLYRDGNSEYLINNNRVRLSDIQILLAKSNFGQKTYSVIGQGIVEGFLNTSLAERKEFFDEATGVKQFQIKRDDSLNKLINSYENLNQAKMLLNEIEPRLKSLTKQVDKLKKRDQIEAELKNSQLNYYSKLWHEINNKFNQFNSQIISAEKIKLEKEKKTERLNREIEQQKKQNQDETIYNQWQIELARLESERNGLIKQLAILDARMELKLEASGQFDLAWLNNKKNELNNEIKKITEETLLIGNNINCEKNKLLNFEQQQQQINKDIKQLNDELLIDNLSPENQATVEIVTQLKKLLNKLDQAEKEHSLDKIKVLIQEIRQEINQLLNPTIQTSEQKNLESVKQKLIEITLQKEEIFIKINESNFRIMTWSERIKLINERKDGIKLEIINIENKLSLSEKKSDSRHNNGLDNKEIQKKITLAEIKIKELKENINSFNNRQNETRNNLFTLQKNSQNIQLEINNLTAQLNELKINSARHETRLEDLENDIRNNFNGLKEIKEYSVPETIDMTFVLEKIDSLKKQIDQIGGIDPEVEKEYNETKKRYDFLDNQVNDLDKTIDSLEKIIKELDIVIIEQFNKEFKNISAKFEEYFKILFNGGQAKIIKIMAETEEKENENKQNNFKAEEIIDKETLIKNTEQTVNLTRIKFLQKHNSIGMVGIEIQATPPGKKIKSVAMLSGGERALTAIALICAIISSNPSPFVVLDEVDASLDEANSERIAKILDDLSHKTQFIVITHNRASMRRASILYGVTMGDDGVSKLLSIKLGEEDK